MFGRSNRAAAVRVSAEGPCAYSLISSANFVFFSKKMIFESRHGTIEYQQETARGEIDSKEKETEIGAYKER